MSTQAIHASNVGKRYVLRQRTSHNYTALRDVLTDKARGLFSNSGASVKKDFWALSGVSFELGHGERLGIIGRNGAGKSTLLKILSRITAPTTGRIEMRGRLASLLEVGTGFHPELTGRENIYLNGSILGMSRHEIRSQFDAIVQFAEVEDFLDTPVKRYSSGMYVRLAFAVAAHMEPEILIVDEVLAVGDAQFQKKCLGKMQDVSRSGRTILFVSHNMGAIRQLCNRCLYLENGKVKALGATDQVMAQYFGLGNRTELQGFTVSATPRDPSGEWTTGTFIDIEISWEKGRYAPGWHADIACYTLEGEKLFALQSHTLKSFDSSSPHSNSVLFSVQNPGLVDRDIRLDFGIRKALHQPYDIVIENALLLSPGNRLIEFNQLTDVLMVPQTQCTAQNK